jgi:hypothetical protein
MSCEKILTLRFGQHIKCEGKFSLKYAALNNDNILWMLISVKFLCYYCFSSNRCILPLLNKWQLKCTSIPLQSFGADGSHLAGSSLPGNHTVQMFVMLLEDNASSLLDNLVVH